MYTDGFLRLFETVEQVAVSICDKNTNVESIGIIFVAICDVLMINNGSRSLNRFGLSNVVKRLAEEKHNVGIVLMKRNKNLIILI
jgi:hypothetical protein